MKLKLINLWIPFLVAFSPVALNLITFYLNSESLNEILAVVWLGSIITLVFIYFPLVIVQISKNKIHAKERMVNTMGVFSVLFMVLGLIYRIYHLPGASMCIMLGCAIFYLNYLPAWYVSRYKVFDLSKRILYFLFCLCVALLVIGFQFKTMSWQGYAFFTKASLVLSTTVLLPYGLYLFIFRGEKKYIPVDSKFLFGFTIAYIIGGAFGTKITIDNTSRVSKTQSSIETNIRLYQQKNNLIYNSILLTSDSHLLAHPMKANVRKLKNESESIVNYIQGLKALLVNATSKTTVSQDSISYKKLSDKSNQELASQLLIGDDYTLPKTGKNSASELKNALKNYLTKLDSIIPEKHALELRQSNPFNFDDVFKNDEIVVKWEIANFYNETLGNVYTTLTLFQSHIMYLEMIVLNALFVEMNSSINQSFASQLSEVTMKYEIAKSDKVIAELEKTKLLNDIKIQTKNAEISSREQTITYFILALIAFVILTVFIIRSNVLRKEANLLLSEKNEIISLQKKEVENQKHLVEEKQKEILESITYAKRLQEAILPPADYFSDVTANYFILYKPKDIVAGDFYWAEKVGDLFYVAAADSTGHGVPGAMVSVVCSTALSRAVKEFGMKRTGDILDKTRELVIETFEKSKSEVKDGMDISLLCFDRQKQQITWSGANNPLWYVNNGELLEIKADKQPIGKTEYPKPFNTHTIANGAGLVFYLFTDGLPDQFGGPNGKKYKYKQFSDLLIQNKNLNFAQQQSEIENSFTNWKGELEQVDDVCVIGISFT